MITKEELQSIPRIYKNIERDREQLLYLEEKATAIPSILPDPNKVQTSPSNNANRYSDAAIDLGKEIEIKEAELKSLKKKAKVFINKLPAKTHTQKLAKQIMKYRFIECVKWNEIADLLGYDVIYIQKVARVVINDRLLQ